MDKSREELQKELEEATAQKEQYKHKGQRLENRLDFAPSSRAIAGYSLAGLFSLWAVFTTDVFDRTASVSGSLWYDGFLEFVGANVPHGSVEQVYLSLGDREKNTRNPRMVVVEDRTKQIAELLRSRGIPVTFELNQGGHFNDAPGRIARAINALMQPAQSGPPV